MLCLNSLDIGSIKMLSLLREDEILLIKSLITGLSILLAKSCEILSVILRGSKKLTILKKVLINYLNFE